ncbi:MAG: hypothetical protein IAF38_08975 [Bacteroidia bacterium]|nr:hypothetical protein [Bacteroidia bacterium]
MKSTFFKSALALGLFLVTNSMFSRESLPIYSVVSDKAESTLKKTEALFVFRFSLHPGYKVDEKTEIKTGAIKISYNGKNLDLQRDKEGKISVTVKPGKYLFKVFYNENYSEITTDSISIKGGYRKEIELNFMSARYPVIAEKPVIYVYPKEKTDVTIQLDLKGTLGFTYPEYKNKWSFTANTDGTILMGDKKFNYLFWEGETGIEKKAIDNSEGFIVGKNELVDFLEKKLSEMGLNSKESADFITYWAPQMAANEKNYVHFLFNAECDEYAQLNIEPKPEQVFRVFMLWSKAEGTNAKALTEQKMPVFNRNGLSVLEWGGAKLPIISF